MLGSTCPLLDARYWPCVLTPLDLAVDGAFPTAGDTTGALAAALGAEQVLLQPRASRFLVGLTRVVPRKGQGRWRRSKWEVGGCRGGGGGSPHTAPSHSFPRGLHPGAEVQSLASCLGLSLACRGLRAWRGLPLACRGSYPAEGHA